MPDIDYAALAKQNGAIASQPAGGGVDYEALAKQHGAVASQPPPSALHRLASGLYESTVAPIVQTVVHPIDTAVSTAKTLLGTDDFGAAVQQAQQGNYGRAALIAGKAVAEGPTGRMAAATLDPIEHDIQTGNYAGAFGRVLGTTAMIAGPEVLPKVVSRAAGVSSDVAQHFGVPEALRSSAEAEYARVLNPTTKGNKIRTANVVPELIDRKVIAGTRKGLASKAATEVQSASTALEDAYDNLPAGASVPLQPILDRLNQAKQQFTQLTPTGNAVPMSAVADLALKHIDDLSGRVSQFGTMDPVTGKMGIPIDAARSLRQYYDQVAAQAGRYSGTDLAQQSQGAVHGIGADAIRNGIADNFPDVAKANREFKLWKDTQQVIDDTNLRKQGQSPSLMSQIVSGGGAAAGFVTGGIHGGVLGKYAMGALQDAVSSPAWRTVSAVLKDQLADAITKRASGPAQFYANKIINQVKQQNAIATPSQPPPIPPAQGALFTGQPPPVPPPAAAPAAPAPAPIPPAPAAAAPAIAAESMPAAPPELAAIERHLDATTTPVPATLGTDVTTAPTEPAPIAETGTGNGSGIRRETLREPYQAVAGERPQNSRAQTTVITPGTQIEYPAQYEIVDRKTVQPSHNPQNFEPNPKYGLNNERDYSNPINQGKVTEPSTKAQFNPRYHITDNPDAVNGPSVIDQNNDVLGGSSRAMMIHRVYDADPGAGFGYKSRLAADAEHYGATAEEVNAMHEPMLVRRIDTTKMSQTAKDDAIANFNRSGTAPLTPSERAIADARRITPSSLDDIGKRLDAKGADATLAQVLQGTSGIEVLNNLVKDGVLSPSERAAYTGEDKLTDAGKDRISGLMLGRYFSNAKQMDLLPASMRNKMERIAAPLARVEGAGGFDLAPHMKQALDLLEDANAHGAKTLDEHLTQLGMFADKQYSPQAVELAKSLLHRNPNDLTNAVRKYVQAADYAKKYEGPGMFGDIPDPQTPAEAFASSFNPDAHTAAQPSGVEPQKPRTLKGAVEPTR